MLMQLGIFRAVHYEKLRTQLCRFWINHYSFPEQPGGNYTYVYHITQPESIYTIIYIGVLRSFSLCTYRGVISQLALERGCDRFDVHRESNIAYLKVDFLSNKQLLLASQTIGRGIVRYVTVRLSLWADFFGQQSTGDRLRLIRRMVCLIPDLTKKGY
ncbi:hypothetical protein M501DRAFT_623424 [Patellaria atrata CBS 101060]|uniref:Uncharacterized protein n=1 Tax=Patellaria atrata CBS 101060 TaxID=1346257 RepID=A0A9P4VUH7_9PEZI|nr:hypothetical protein M501DRAFT_623424 [Patellaria atrata CBS 101060]